MGYKRSIMGITGGNNPLCSGVALSIIVQGGINIYAAHNPLMPGESRTAEVTISGNYGNNWPDRPAVFLGFVLCIIPYICRGRAIFSHSTPSRMMRSYRSRLIIS